ncbi:hypothetical protein GCM10022260_05670 [Gaetbulibacter aestuarii]
MKKHVINFIWVAVGVMIYNLINYLIGIYFFSKEDYDYLNEPYSLSFLIQIVVVYLIVLSMRFLCRGFKD